MFAVQIKPLGEHLFATDLLLEMLALLIAVTVVAAVVSGCQPSASKTTIPAAAMVGMIVFLH